MAYRLYVGGLPWATTDDELRETFSAAGEVEDAVVIRDRMTNRSRGFAFVTMVDEAGGTAAIEMFNEKEFGGRTLTVNEARPREERGGDGGGSW